MKSSSYFVVLAVIILPIFTGFTQAPPPVTIAQPANKPSALSAPAAEVEKLAQSHIGDDVILAFIAQHQSAYNLSAADIAALKDAGVSEQVLTAILNHDTALRAQQATDYAPAPRAAGPIAQSEIGPGAVSNSTPPTATTVGQPPVPAETIPVSPGPDYVWTPGYWSWSGGVWVWIRGYWHYPVSPGHIWIGGYWSGHGHCRHWVGGHWR